MSRMTCLSLGLILSSFMNGAAADDRPAGFVTLCAKDASCTVQTTTNVAFGRDNRFAYKVLSGTFVCNAATFGSSTTDGECSVPGKLLRAPAQRPGTPSYTGPVTVSGADSST